MLLRILRFSFIGLMLVGFTACTSDDGDQSSNEGTDAVFNKANSAVSSAYGASQSLTSFNVSNVNCDSGATQDSMPGDPEYAGESAFCLLNTNSKSPDTVQGTYYIVSKVLCAVEKSISFQYLATATNHDGILLDESDSCFGAEGFDATDDGDTLDQFPISLSDMALSSGPYEFYIGIQLGALTYNGANTPDVEFYLKDSGGILSARVYQEGSDSHVEFVLDSNTGAFYFENRDYDNQRHVRLAVDGSFSTSTGAFSSVTSAKLIHTEGDSAGSSRSMIMDFNGTTDAYDHHIDDVRDTDYTATSITYDNDFYDWTGRAVTDHSPATDPLLDLSTFDMSF